MNNKILPLSSLLLLTLLSACSTSRYQFSEDHHPDDIPPLAHIEDVIPRYEPYSRGGNKDYRVRGIDYNVLLEVNEFSEQGYASWYGNKFHGHLTSNGERYDMYAMSAAHKNLPLPSYVEVTNLENNKKVIVRINDRGPFHEGRIIDLSYAAADKLEMLNAGTAKVSIKLLHFSAQQNQFENDFLNGYFYIQYLVTSQADKAEKLSESLSKEHQVESDIIKDNKIYRLRLGPLNNLKSTQRLLTTLQQQYPSAFIIKQTKK